MLSAGIFLIILLIFGITLIGSWLYTRHSLKNNFLSFKNLDESLIKKYNLLDYNAIDKKKTWIDLSIWNVTLCLFIQCILLLFLFLIFKSENNSLFIASLIVIIIGSVICLVLCFLISFFLWKKHFFENKEQINLNMNEFISKIASYRHVEIDQFIKTNIYNFREKNYQKLLNKSLLKLKFKSNDQWNIKHYTIFLKYAHYFIFNLKNSNIDYVNCDFEIICDQTLNNLMFKIYNNYVLELKLNY